MSIAKVFPIPKKKKKKRRGFSDNSKNDGAEDSKKIKRRVFRKPMLETSLLQGSTIQAVVIFYLTA